VRNVGFNRSEIENRIQGAIQGLPQDSNGQNAIQRPRVSAYRIGFTVARGQLNMLGDWQFFGGYRYLERDSLPDGFTSSDYRMGGTDQRASFLGGSVALSSRVNLRLFATSARSIDAPIKYGVDTYFIDLNGSF
jgi:hypothetical protein